MEHLFGWLKFRLDPDEAEDTRATKARAEVLAEAAARFSEEAPAVGERQRQIRRENHFGRRIDGLYHKEA